MAYLRINSQTIYYDEKLPYQSIGVVGSGHGGAVYDTFHLNPRSYFGHQSGNRKRVSQDILRTELTHDLGLVRGFLKTGIFNGDNGTKKLIDEDKPAFERTVKLYHEVLSALRGK
ncbi:MAG: hypothetical protein Q8R37_02910 [Nanoarchaeota archaeon]|nr:hypothetical protein [Nanoarchaeota archaeon]